jgi:hypothetical protein
MDDLDVIILDRLNELANKAAVLAAGLVRTGIDRPSMSAFVNLAWELSHDIGQVSSLLQAKGADAVPSGDEAK